MNEAHAIGLEVMKSISNRLNDLAKHGTYCPAELDEFEELFDRYATLAGGIDANNEDFFNWVYDTYMLKYKFKNKDILSEDELPD